tara:strand:+ start:391 stop:1110 length:720 start_codon:yes stop_codon:yes gene_type:complete
MHTCEECKESFGSFQAKANHVRWQHKKEKFSKEGLDKLKLAADRTNDKRWGMKIIESVSCPLCGSMFERSRRLNQIKPPKKFCSRSCANTRVHSKETKTKLSKACWANESFVKHMGKVSNNRRFSSKAERKLAEMLGDKFRRHKQVVLCTERRIDVDISHREKDIWIESDGPYHFQKIHKNHDFEKSKLRDKEQNDHCLKNNILLIRVDNSKFSIQDQIYFIKEEISRWDGTGHVAKLY